MNKKKKSLIVVLVLLNIALITLLLLISGVIKINNGKENNNEPEVIVNPEPITPVDNRVLQPERETWLKNKAINEDYQGEVIFDSGLLSQPFVQAKSVYDKNGRLYHFYTEGGTLVKNGSNYNGNDVYIWTNWRDMTYDYDILGGSVFMDYRCDLDSQNVIIYGHYFSVYYGKDPERNKSFTPLEKLLDKQNYADNNKVKLVLDNENREYELVCVYIFDTENEEMMEKCQYWRCEYNYDDYSLKGDENYYQNYIDCIHKYQRYDTGVELNTEDKTLTLQTCVVGAPTKYEVCVFKLIDTQYFDESLKESFQSVVQNGITQTEPVHIDKNK